MTPREPRIGGENRIIRMPMLAANHGRKSHGRKSRGNRTPERFRANGSREMRARSQAPWVPVHVKKRVKTKVQSSVLMEIRTGLQTQKNAASRRKRRLIDHDT